ncbi:hypothetical protein [Corynebacterium massiliense]|uniref:DUF2269 domain-containing protein n=1 Tax=Corynebacterium massiliense DSM 45435 TaxID=1121364 RepID=A0ABY7U6I8_9CORY|nr:hypothetical protein [Corynebacterium massiliense]WCZ32296.1 hypothetical protein CMASS_04225 [Corynebacterium massiliense DSM 45435]
MTTVVTALHVLAAIVLLGPVVVAVSMFPAQMLRAKKGDTTALGSAQTLHRITSTYSMFSALVPVLGLAVFLTDLDTYGSMWQFHTAILLSVIAWGLLLFVIVPREKKALAALEGETQEPFDYAKAKKQLAMFGGIFNLLWVITAILMFL